MAIPVKLVGSWPKKLVGGEIGGMWTLQIDRRLAPKQMGLGLTPLPNSGSVTLGRLRYVFGVQYVMQTHIPVGKQWCLTAFGNWRDSLGDLRIHSISNKVSYSRICSHNEMV